MKKLFILLVIGLAILLIVQFPHATISPGELTEGHQKLNNECLSCHKPFDGIASEKCLSCHKVEDIGKGKDGKQNKPLFHQELYHQECSSCHTEHQGLNPTHAKGGFKHELLSPATLNNCSNCHDKPKDAFHGLFKDNCNKCHGLSKWVPSTFDHSTYFKLDQNHTTTCNTCHPNNNYNSYTCYGCHEHAESKIIEAHNEEGIYNISNCVSCHKSGNEHDIKTGNNRLNVHEQKKIKDFIRSKDGKEKDDD